jgi:hypothetical protein
MSHKQLWNAVTGFEMTAEQSKILALRLRRLVEFRWQREVIARWLDGSGVLDESQSQFQRCSSR